jgi:hypothetical protein
MHNDDGCVDDTAAPGFKSPKMTQLKMHQQKVLTQAALDEYILDYVVENVLSLHHVSSAGFTKFVTRLTQGHLSPRCRQTITRQLEDRFTNQKEALRCKLESVEYICTTADCWTSRRRGFLGVTAHWLDSITLERKGACLAVRELKGKHTYDVIAQALESVHDEFQISSRVCFTVTDSGANFLKAFKHFGLEETDVAVSTDNSNSNNEDNEDMQFAQVNDVLQPQFNSDEDVNEYVVYKLPPHRKCSCHLLNLVASKDTEKIEGQCKQISTQTFAKLTALWNKQNRSVNVAELIRESLGMLLVTPGDTRWNSFYDAMKKVNGILSNPELEAKFHKLCDDIGIKRLTNVQKVFIAEYVRVMAPLCCGLDVLQGDKIAALGFLLPTLTVMKIQLEEMLNDANSDSKLTLCRSLAEAVLAGITNRFADVFQDNNAKLAAVVHPQFKLDWICNGHDKSELTRMLKDAVSNLVDVPDPQQREEASAASSSSTTSTSASTSSFFARFKRNADTVPDEANQEVEKFLADASQDVQSLKSYPNIRKLFVKLNTGLPSSASVERLFSLGGRVFTPMRSRLSSSHFEMMVFLRALNW